MAQFELVMPKMGESIMEATILKWVKKVGDSVDIDETILEIATDKVDSEVPSPAKGVITQILFPEDTTVEIGKVIAIIASEGAGESKVAPVSEAPAQPTVKSEPTPISTISSGSTTTETIPTTAGGKFYSPLVKNIAEKESVTINELDSIAGTGANGRVTKKDILSFVESKANGQSAMVVEQKIAPITETSVPATPAPKPAQSYGGNVEIIEMDRMRKLIADHMVMSKQTSPHVTSYVEIDVTDIVKWRDKVKDKFEKKYGEKITYTPIFVQAVARAIADFPMINISVDGTNLIRKKDINIGMAAALPSGNLIVPVIKNADMLNLVGLTKSVNDLANRARANQLKPDEIQNGTFTLTNVGTFGNVMGTPIINQPQVAIMAVGAIRKKPAVVETPYGDMIAIRQLMFLSLSYDHRVVDGSLGGSFLRRVGDYLEKFDVNQEI
jgi:2-oxoglutarate dehydrogenase E2 component (dihydrolipoamide succinyltransferase)